MTVVRCVKVERKGVMKNRALLALLITLVIQAYVSLTTNATSVLAPEIAPELGVSPALIGVFIGLVYVGAMISSLASGGFIERYGAIRVSQVCVVLSVIGVALVAGPLSTLPVAALLIGLGYGAITPASSQLLARTTPLHRMGLTFSIKQTGVPLGAAVAGVLLPALGLIAGWHAAVFAVAGIGIVIAILSEPTRRELDTGLRPGQSISIASVFAPLRLIARNPVLLELSISGYVFAIAQGCLMSYLVVFLTHSAGYSLLAAGLALTVANIGSVVGRLGWGFVADRWLAPRLTLAVIGMSAGLCALATANFSAAWPSFSVLVICAVFGATAIGWNGVLLSEVARHSPQGQAGAITGGALFSTFAGTVTGPPIFALLVGMTGSYRLGFAVVGIIAIGWGAQLLWRHRGNASR